MFEVLHPYENKLITHPEYIQLASNKGFQIPNNYVGGRCPVCKRQMKVRAGHKKDDGHFYHNDNEFCPTKEPAARPYLGKTSTNVDLAAAKQNVEFVKTYIEHIWNRLTEMVPYLDLKEFIEILKESKRLNVYGYVNIDPKLLPYVYVTLISFLPSKSLNKQRKLTFYFFNDASEENCTDLWIDKGSNYHLIRISYDGSQTKRVTLINMETNYLSLVKKTLSEKQKNWLLSEI